MKLGIIRPVAPESFDYAKEKGLDFIEICSNYDNETENFIASADDILRNIDRTGIPVLSVGRWNAEPLKEGRIDEDVFGMICRQIDVVAKIGCPVFNLGVNYDNSQTRFRNYALAIEYLRRIVEYAGERNVTAALYNCSWNNFIYSDPAWDIICEEIPEIKIKYDCSHAFARGGDYLSEIDSISDRNAHKHIKGSCKINGRYVDDPPAGLDFIEWYKVFAILYAHDYDGNLSIEPHSSVWQGEMGERGIDYTIGFIRPKLMR